MGDSIDGFVLAIIVVGFILLLLFTPFGDFLTSFFSRTEASGNWYANVYANPINGGSVSPSGNVSVPFGESLNIEAVASEGWYFKEWSLNGTFYSTTPIVEVPTYNENTTVNLVATFEIEVTTFEITPSRSFVAGSSNVYLEFWLKNNGDADITNIKLKLNDPYGIFESFTVPYSKTSQVATHWLVMESVLNRWMSNYLYFGGAISFVDHRTVESHSENVFYAGSSYTYGPIKVSADAESGTYVLFWEISFQIASGQFSEPPTLIIPWEVTIY